MTSQPAIETIAGIRDLLAGGASIQAEEADDGQVDTVIIELAEPVPVAELERTFGPAAKLPTAPAGGRSVRFPQTQPAEGESRWSVFGRLARWDEDGMVTEILLRFDQL